MAFEPTSRNAPNRVNRLADRAVYDEEAVFAIIDKSAVCHVTFKLPNEDGVPDNDWPGMSLLAKYSGCHLLRYPPVVIPMIFGRKDNT
jgi:nitroimidazol reductase NimA-like FMN-containing flavoprotein (pyridoxamine 5'-phosphate oxidase superfamily)